MTRITHLLTPLAAAALLGPTATAVDLTWDDGAGDDQFATAANWNPDQTPAQGDNVFFGQAAGDTITVGDAGATFGNQQADVATFTSAAGAYTFTNEDRLSLTGITLESGAGDVTFNQGSGGPNNSQVQFRSGTFVLAVPDATQTLTFGSLGYNGKTMTQTGLGTVVALDGFTPSQLDIQSGVFDLRHGIGNVKVTSAMSNGFIGSGTITNTDPNADAFISFGQGSNGDTFSGVITGDIDLYLGRDNNNDSFTQVFDASSTLSYTGTTDLNGGAFIVNGTQTGAGDFQVAGRPGDNQSNDATLGGNGSVGLASGASLVVGGASDDPDDNPAPFFTNNTSRGILAPGFDDPNNANDNAIGDISVTADTLAFIENGTLAIDLAANANSDLLALTGNLDLSNAGDILSLNDLGGAFDGTTYTIATFTGTRTGTFDSVEGLDSNYLVVYNGINAGNIQLQVIPEPASLALLAAGGLCLLPRRRR
jgi:hypothetical protein